MKFATGPANDEPPPAVEALSAVTLATRDRGRAIAFYRSLGFRMLYGGPDAPLTSFAVGTSYLNLVPAPPQSQPPGDVNSVWWGRVIFYVSDVDAMYARTQELGLEPHAPPQDAEWGERYFHVTDPDGHELSFARPLDR